MKKPKAKGKLIPLIFVMSSSLSVFGCGGKPSGDQHMILRRGLGGEPASLDPASAADTFSVQVVQDLYEGLLREGPSGEIYPAVAASWTVDAQGTTYTFELRRDARWSDGRPVQAQDFVTAWQRVVDPKNGSPVSNDLRLISGAAEIISGRSRPDSLGIRALSDTELIVKLEQPAPYFPQLLSHSSTFPIAPGVPAASTGTKGRISNGAYVLVDWRPGASLDLTRNEQYWDKAQVKIKRVRYQIAPDQYAQFAAYRSGELDFTDTIPANALPSFRADHPSEVVIAPYSAIAFYGLNVAEPPFSNNPKLRTALAMAIDRGRLVKALAVGQVEAYGLVPPGIRNYNTVEADWKDYSDSKRLAEARRLYREAGYSPTRPLHIRLLFNSNPSIKQTATLVAAMWRQELGVDTNLSDEEFRVFLQSRKDRKRWDVIRLAWNADYNDAGNFLDVLRSDSPSNDTGYTNALFDAKLDIAAHTLAPEARQAVLQSAEKILLEDSPIIPLYFFVSKHLVKPYVIGMKPNPFDRIRSQTLALAPH